MPPLVLLCKLSLLVQDQSGGLITTQRKLGLR
jgi:hypothetical protein